jgi:3-oxoadipate enol-lactonase
MEQQEMSDIARERITAAFSDGVDEAMREYFVEQVAKNDKRAYLQAPRAVFSFDPENRLTTIRCPTLVSVGREDRVTPVALAEFLAKSIEGAQLVVLEGAGHISNAENPLAFNRAVVEFYRKHFH